MDGITLLTPRNTMARGLDTFLDDDLDSSAIMFHAHARLGADGAAAASTAAGVHDWNVSSNLCISIDHESSPSHPPCDSIFDLPSSCLTAPVERKRKDAVESNDDTPRAEKRVRLEVNASDTTAPSSSTVVQFTGVHNETSRFTLTAFGSTARTLGAPCSFSSSTPFCMARSVFVSSVPSSSSSMSSSCSSAHVPATPRLRCFD